MTTKVTRPYKAFGYPVIPGLYVLCASAFCVNLLIMSPVYSGAGLGIVALGGVVYGVWGRMGVGKVKAGGSEL